MPLTPLELSERIRSLLAAPPGGLELAKLADVVSQCEDLTMTLVLLKQTLIGRAVNTIRKRNEVPAELLARMRALVSSWKQLAAPPSAGGTASARNPASGSGDSAATPMAANGTATAAVGVLVPPVAAGDCEEQQLKRKGGSGGGGGGKRSAKKAQKQKSTHDGDASAPVPSKRPHNNVWFYSRSKKHGVQPAYAAFSNLYGGVGSNLPVPAGHAAYIAAAGNTVASEPPQDWPLVIGGKRWWSTEAYYQAAKYEAAAPAYAEVIRRCPYNSIVFALGCSSKNPFAISMQKDAAVKEFYHGHFSGMNKAAAIRPDWDDVKDTVMHDALRAKYSAVAGLRALLLSTGDKVIVERTPRDSYWGDGLGAGRNMLGTLLMKVRGELRPQAQVAQGKP